MAWLQDVRRVPCCLYLISYGVVLICNPPIGVRLIYVASWEGISTSGVAAIVSYTIARLPLDLLVVRCNYVFK